MNEDPSQFAPVSNDPNKELLARNQDLLAEVNRLQQQIEELTLDISALKAVMQQLKELNSNKTKLLSTAIHDLRQPLQTLDLLCDALNARVKDDTNKKYIDRFEISLVTASNIVARIGEITRLDADAVVERVAASRPEHKQSEASPAERSILVVGGDPGVIATCEALLAGGHPVSVAADGWQALELSVPGTKWPDLVITDYDLPNGLNGFDMMVSLQERLDHELAALILTSNISHSTARAIERRGYIPLVKTVDAATLRACVRDMFARLQDKDIPPSIVQGKEETTTLFVVDDDPIVLEALHDVLEGAGYTVESYATGAAFFTACSSNRSGCLLVDALMPEMDGFEVLSRLRTGNYALSAIMVTGAGDVAMAVRAMKAGAVDFIEKPVSSRELLNCVRNALAATPSGVAVSSRQNAAEARFATLTERQRQIVNLILEGKPNKTIADKLGLSQRTVESHRAAIMRKTGAKSFAALVRWAIAVS